ncbi:MAG: transmembrane amino acid transporter protein-domain-containing protein [Monoraphidium minutum]|nr:MAG: transmembrane amino acid transporter protein-domain-containing protein [Monoraphidium minutum]
MSVTDPLLNEEAPPLHKRCTVQQTLLALLALQLGWGLWLLPHAFSLLGWVPALTAVGCVALTTAYSGGLFTRLFLATPGTVLFGDIAEAAGGPSARALCYTIVYTLDGTRCVILHLAATQSLEHALGSAAPPLWQCGLIVLVVAAIASQIRALSELSGFFLLGTTAQLIGIGIVIYQLLTEPDPDAKHAAFVKPGTGDATVESQFVAFFNIIFAYGGQFAFVELMTSMVKPSRFPIAISTCTAIMTALYASLAAIGYQSKGSAVAEIVIFSLGDGPHARFAAACILVQALSQYLVNTNVWSHNLLVLVQRRLTDADGAAVVVGRRENQAAAVPRCSSDHARLPWAAATVFVVTYSYLFSMSVPYFSTLVGIVASSTYLVCAYTLPCWFALRLFPTEMGAVQRAACRAAIPVTLLLSAAGFVCSVSTLIRQIREGGSAFGPPV